MIAYVTKYVLTHDIAKRINEELASESYMAVDKTLQHPDGRIVKIKSGQYLDPVYGRVSNF